MFHCDTYKTLQTAQPLIRHYDLFSHTVHLRKVVRKRTLFCVSAAGALYIKNCGLIKVWFSHLLRAGRSGDRIPVVARFSAPVQTDSVAHPSSYTMRTDTFPGNNTALAWRWPPTSI